MNRPNPTCGRLWLCRNSGCRNSGLYAATWEVWPALYSVVARWGVPTRQARSIDLNRPVIVWHITALTQHNNTLYRPYIRRVSCLAILLPSSTIAPYKPDNIESILDDPPRPRKTTHMKTIPYSDVPWTVIASKDHLKLMVFFCLKFSFRFQ